MFNESLREIYTNYGINHYLTISILLIIFSKIASKIKNSNYDDKIFRYGISIYTIVVLFFAILTFKKNMKK